MAIQISDHFTLGRLARFTAPTCAMMLFTSIYGLFVSNFVGKESFAALNLVYPLFMMLGALGYMFGTGGTALVAKTMGGGRRQARPRAVLACRVRDAHRWHRVRGRGVRGRRVCRWCIRGRRIAA